MAATEYRDEAEFIKVASEDMLADGGTKGLTGIKFVESECKLSGNYQ